MKKLLNSRLSKSLLCAGCTLLIVGVADAKPDQSKGKGEKGGKGGGSDHSEKHSSDKGGGKDHKDDKGGGKDHKEDKGDGKDHKENKDHKNDDKGKEAKHDDKSEPWRAHRFAANDRSEFLDYFKGYESNPHGLPPGLAKNLQRGKPLPPGWQKKVNEGYIIEDGDKDFFQVLEDSLFPRMKPIPNTRMYLYGDRVVRVYEPKRQVVDVFPIPTIKY